MPIAAQISNHARLMYSQNVMMVAQQTTFPIFDAVTTVTGTGEAMSAADLFAEASYQYAEERSRTNPETIVAGSRRWLVRPVEIEAGHYIDKEDTLDNMLDPTSNIMRTLVAGVQRGRQDRLLGVREVSGGYVVSDGGIYGSAVEGKRPGTSGTALPAGQTLIVNVDGAGTGLTINKLRKARRKLKEANFGLDQLDPLYALITPAQEDDLLAIAQSSGLYLNAFDIQQLRDGKPTSLMGVTWIVSNRVPKDASNNDLCAIWAKSNVVEGVWEPVAGDMWRDPSKKNKPYAYVSYRGDCVRLQDKGVFLMPCTPT